MTTFEAVEIDNILAQATATVLYGRPDIFNQVFEHEDLQVVCRYALEHRSTGVRETGERGFIARGWNEIVALVNAHAANAQAANAAVSAWYENIDTA